MIDATKSPVPAWKRLGLIVLLAVLVLAAGYVIWTKELHHSTSPASSPAPASAPVTLQGPASAPASGSRTIHTPPTTAGLPVSSRDPFG